MVVEGLFGDNYEKDLEFLIIQVGQVFTFRGQCQYKAYDVLCLRLLCFFPFHLDIICSMTYMWSYFIDLWARPKFDILMLDGYEMRHVFQTMLYFCKYKCAIKVED